MIITTNAIYTYSDQLRLGIDKAWHVRSSGDVFGHSIYDMGEQQRHIILTIPEWESFRFGEVQHFKCNMQIMAMLASLEYNATTCESTTKRQYHKYYP